MKIKIDNAEIGVQVTQKMVCPAGTAYWQIDYMFEGVCIHSAHIGAIYGSPNPVATLDWTYMIRPIEYHYQDISAPDPQPTDGMMYGKRIKVGSVNGRPAWWVEKGKTHREAIIESLGQIVRKED